MAASKIIAQKEHNKINNLLNSFELLVNVISFIQKPVHSLLMRPDPHFSFDKQHSLSASAVSYNRFCYIATIYIKRIKV